MAAQKKRKSTSSRTRSTTRRTGKKKSTSPRKMTQKERAQKNQVWAFVLFFLALISVLAIVHIEAPFIDFIGVTARCTVGSGVFLLPLSFVFAGVLLFISRGKPVKTRVICTLLAPLAVGCLMHSILGDADFTKGLAQMLDDGNNLTGGGLLAGYISAVLVTYISRYAAIPLFLLITILVVCGSFNITFMDIIDSVGDWIKSRPRGVEYDEEYYEEEDELEQAPAVRMPRRRRPVIDIPLDGEEREDENKPIKLRPARVKSPAEILAEEQAGVQAEPYHINPDNFSVDSADIIACDADDVDNANIVEENNLPADIKAEPAPGNAGEEFKVPEEEKSEQKELYSYPPISLLTESKNGVRADAADARAHGQRLVETIRSFGIEVHLVGIVRGPSVTRYEVQLDPGVKFSRLTGLSDDIALALGSSSVYIAPIPDKSAIGIEVPNKEVQTVNIRDVIGSKEFTASESNVTFAMGKDISGNCIVGDIAKLPHLLIAGTTGSGKSVCMNSLIISLLYKSTPEQVRLIMVDPKMVELGIYNGIPHLLVPVVTDPKKASGALQWAVLEMMKRYKLFAENNVRDMQSYNRAVSKSGEGEPLPQIVIVIDELADLMVVARKEVEDSIMRLTQMARAAGMHLIIATQRPSVDVITGVIKSNIPSRIAFAVASKVESNIILGSAGAEKLIGKGDMLFAPIGSTKPTRIQGCFISGKEVEAVVAHVKKGGDAEYSNEIIEQIEKQAEQKENSAGAGDENGELEADEMLDSAIDVVVETGQASVSMLQRRLKLGYSRAARIVDQMEARGIVGPFEGAKPRQLLITKEQWQEIKMRRES